MVNFGKILNKKVVIIFVIVLILFAGGFFCWWQEDKIETFIENKKREKMVAPSKDYSVVEESGEKFILNEKDGFKAKIPTDWNVELGEDMEILESDREVTLYSKDFNYYLSKGCLIRIQINRLERMWVEEYGVDFVMYPFEGAEEIREEISAYKESTQEEKENMRERGIEIILVNQRESLKETIMLKEDIGEYVTVKIPTENKLYIFSNTQFFEKCEEEFNEFLETVSIF